MYFVAFSFFALPPPPLHFLIYILLDPCIYSLLSFPPYYAYNALQSVLLFPIKIHQKCECALQCSSVLSSLLFFCLPLSVFSLLYLFSYPQVSSLLGDPSRLLMQKALSLRPPGLVPMGKGLLGDSPSGEQSPASVQLCGANAAFIQLLKILKILIGTVAGSCNSMCCTCVSRCCTAETCFL